MLGVVAVGLWPIDFHVLCLVMLYKYNASQIAAHTVRPGAPRMYQPLYIVSQTLAKQAQDAERRAFMSFCIGKLVLAKKSLEGWLPAFLLANHVIT